MPPERRLVIRPGPGFLVLPALVVGLAALGLVAMAGSWLGLLGLLVVLPGALLGSRMAVVAGTDSLSIDNIQRDSAEFYVEDLTGFVIAEMPHPGGWAVVALAVDDELPMEATTELSFVPGWRRRLEIKRDRLEAWRTAALAAWEAGDPERDGA